MALIAAAPCIVIAGGHDRGPAPAAAAFDPFVHRPNLVVADIDRALRIYRDILGFRVNVVMPVRETEFMRAVFELPAGAKMRIAFLSSGEQTFGHLGMTEVKGVELPPVNATHRSVLIVEHQRDVDALYAALAAEGCEMSEIFELTAPDRREFIFTDHDGHRVLMMRLRD